jgi:phospholipid transport system substrate-binding protein
VTRVVLIAWLAGSSGVAAKPPTGTAVEVVTPPNCTTEGPGPGPAVAATYAELTQIYRTALPGPDGLQQRDDKIDRLLAERLDVQEFASRTLARAWEAADQPTRERWARALTGLVHARYRSRFGEPGEMTLEVIEARQACLRAEVTTKMSERRSQNVREVVFSVVHRAGRWRLYDVSLDGVSLVRIWRERFHRFYREGGAGELERQLAQIARRYPCAKAYCPPL